MKFLSILAAASLALAPAFASAGSSGDSTADSTANGRPISGPLAVKPMDDTIPAGAIILLGFIVLGGAIIGILSSDSNNNSN